VFRKGRHTWSYFFFFGKHFWTGLDSEPEKSEPRVCLLISEQIDGGEAVRLDQLSNRAVTLREVFVVERTFVRRRFALEQDREVLDRDLSPEAIARDFIREVILNRIA
jgi:hypothetical protein